MFFPTSMAHAAADNNIMATLDLGMHNLGLLHSFPLSSAGPGSIVLYHLAEERKEKDGLLPSTTHFLCSDTLNCASVISSSSSFISLANSKYPGGTISSICGLIPYAYNSSGELMDEEIYYMTHRHILSTKHKVQASQNVV